MLAQSLLTSLPRSIRVLRRLSRESLAKGVTFGQLRLLFLVKEGLGTTQMAEALQVSVAAISKMINLLEQKKFLIKAPALDRRAVELKLTAQGNKILKMVSLQVEERLNRGLGELTQAEKKELARGILLLDRLMELMHD
jgi:DNA-binding MarR family transcriptional regulator